MPAAAATIVRARYLCGYLDYGRIRLAWLACKTADEPDYFTHGSLVSPAGVEWRFFGKGAGCPRFLHDGVYRDLDYGVVLRAMMLGWRWVKDEEREVRHFSISRWPDGSHFYVLGDDIDGEGRPTVTYRGRHKFDTWDEAHAAGVRWQARMLKRKPALVAV